MMKRLLLPGFLFLLLCTCLCISMPVNAQDSTKKAETEKKETPAVAAPAKTRPVYRHHRLYPVANPPAATATPATAPAVNPAIAAQRAKDSAAKTQIDPGQLNAKSLN